MPLLVALLLVAHALIHLSFISRRPPITAGGPAWPFDLGHSWLLGRSGIAPASTRSIAYLLLAVILGGYLVGAMGAIGLGGDALFRWGVVAGSLASVVMLGLFFHPWLTLGIIIDIALLWAVLVAGWYPG